MRTAPPLRALFPTTLIALIAALAAAPAHAAWSTSPYVNLAVALTPSGATSPSILSDGVGGAFVAWQDGRDQATTGNDIYLAHILKAGVMDPAWPVNGLPLCTATGDQNSPVMVADNSGGVIVVWQDGRAATTDIYAARVNSSGTLAAGWTTVNGKQIGAATPAGLARDENAAVACSDGAGGVIVAWDLIYTSSIDEDIYAVRILANGTVAPGWQSLGTVINTSSGHQLAPCIATDGASGAIVAYFDSFLGPFAQIRYRTVTASGAVTIPASDAVAASSSGQSFPVGTSDGQGGMYVAWFDQRVSPAGFAIGQFTPLAPVTGSFY
ncbi:MAG: hypothetical protein ACRENS_00075, partial [Candidatus Eiseniibacteriota bacterium]